ncbi:uncharacterized protein LOC127264145 [Andrographis paniculata]|uniref:uncharacterized protein LOC127264145 n=1 Tax=Andrographis paniculata TaxID=175694 RepID=UPI0021E98DAD|nr:uncharacterized protein LOC127264145 [Andrographis paniculata]
MGKKLDALLGRGFKTSKFRATAAMAVSRSAVLKNQRRARCTVARSDVAELLKTGHHERALLRVEQVIKEQNMLDVLVLLEGYCHLLVERISLIEQDKICPEELKEAVSSLIFASTRCGEFPELQEIRAIFTSRFGKEFAARAVQLRNHCGVSPKVIQKLSTRPPSMETKLKAIQEIATDNNIDLPMETLTGTIMKNETWDQSKRPGPSSSHSRVSSDPLANKPIQLDEKEMDEDLSGSFKLRRRYTDVADAAQAAFESAAYAAAAARAAVELSRSESTDPDDPNSPNFRPKKVSTVRDPMEAHKENLHFEKIHPERSLKDADGMEQIKPKNKEVEFKRSYSGSSSDSLDDHVKGVKILSDEEGKLKQEDFAFNGSDSEDEEKLSIPRTYHRRNGAQVGLTFEPGLGCSPARFDTEERFQSAEGLNINRRPMSVRTLRANGR